ncbi:Alpha/Beta hydrolase protein [Aspergillus germanicus]
MTTSADIREFKIDIPNEEVERLKHKLNDTRLPGREIVPGAGTLYWPSYAWAQELLEEWRRGFDWYRVQGQLNEYPHYLCPIEDLDIHFLHARSGDPDAIPLLLVHGWPGSFYEFSRVWGPLSQPENENAPAFHVVVVSMPGFCWSDWPPKHGWTLQDNARVFDKLMSKLGYSKYMVQGGDWGHFVARELGARYTESCKLVHFNFAPAGSPDEGVERTDEEQKLAVRADDFLENHLGYAVCMRTRPHTIGLALSDNPMGILMWVGEKYNEAANPENQKHASWKEAILATASLYYFTDCIMPSALCYYENVRHENFAEFTQAPANRVQVPFGYSSFHWDVDFSSKRAVEKTGNMVFYREHKNGGHFAALECPSEIVQDLREFASQEWKS